MNDGVVCADCGKVHKRADIELAYKLPDVVHAIDAAGSALTPGCWTRLATS